MRFCGCCTRRARRVYAAQHDAQFPGAPVNCALHGWMNARRGEDAKKCRGPRQGWCLMRPLTPTCGNRAANVSEFDDACALTGVRDAGGAVAQQHTPRAALSRRRLRRRHRVAREVASWCQGVRSAGATTARWRGPVVKWRLVSPGRFQHVTNRTPSRRAPDALWCMIRRHTLRWCFVE